MNAVKATWTNGRILPGEPVDWPDGSELVVEPVGSKIGLDEAMVPDALLADLAKRIAHAGALAEVNEKWSCPSPRTVTALARAGVTLVAGSDSHHCRNIGVYDRWVRPTASAARA